MHPCSIAGTARDHPGRLAKPPCRGSRAPLPEPFFFWG
jgi:hypothetical protein